MRRVALHVLAAAVLLGRAGVARAAECEVAPGTSTCIDADSLWVRPGQGPFFALAPASTSPQGRSSFGLVLSWLSQPIVLRSGSDDRPVVDDAIDATFAYGLGVTDRLEIAIAAPATLYQSGEGVRPVVPGSTDVPATAIRDMRFGLAFAAIERPRTGAPTGPSLVARLELAAPTGDMAAFAGSESATIAPSVTFEQRIGNAAVAAQLEGRFRSESPLAGSVFGTQIGGAAGASYDVLDRGRLTLAAEAFALAFVADQPSGAGSVPAEWIVSATTAPFLAGDVSASIGGGGALPLSEEGAITMPRFRFDLALRYAPTGRDEDADGVLDRDDQCPDVPEDRDGFQDADGCLDPDNDGDRIPDARDRCRDAPETVDGFEDDDGCPDPDDDRDGVPDERDRCRNQPEDVDNFADGDGCPDPDNDGDRIPDEKDRCPSGAEDVDGFKDDDGCPDPDNDLDGVPDGADRCPDGAEDKDGFQDDDGCPDPDDDLDGIPDASDRCKGEAETIDGKTDDDGCPEAGARSLVSWSGDRVVLVPGPSFAPGSAKTTPELDERIRMVATLVRARAATDTVVVEGHPDRAGDTSPRAEDLAARRALAVKDVLVRAGLDASRINAASSDAKQRPPAGFEVTVLRSQKR